MLLCAKNAIHYLDGIRMNEIIGNFFDKLTKYSPIFYIIMLVVVVGSTVNFFNQKILTDHILEILIVLNLIPLTSFAITKATGRGMKTEVSLVCPECNGKMKSSGTWKCSDCSGTFRHGKKDNSGAKK